MFVSATVTISCKLIYMVKCHDRFDAVLETSIYYIVVMLESEFIDGASSKRKNSRPRDGKRVVWYAQGCNPSNVFTGEQAYTVKQNTRTDLVYTDSTDYTPRLQCHW